MMKEKSISEMINEIENNFSEIQHDICPLITKYILEELADYKKNKRKEIK